MKTAIISVTMKGARLGQRVKHSIAPDAICFEKEGKTSGHEDITFSSMKDIIGDVFKTYDRVLCIMAVGIVVRMIAPYIVHKSEDPAIVVMDEAGHNVISLLSGHLGGANEWTSMIGLAVDAHPVITTATDVNGLPAPDVLARQCQFQVDDFKALINVNAAIVAGQTVPYYIDSTLVRVAEFEQAALAHVHGTVPVEVIDPVTIHIHATDIDTNRVSFLLDDAPCVLITDKVVPVGANTLVLRPQTYTVGIGCRRDAPEELILHAVTQSLADQQLSPKSCQSATSVIVKADEQGLLTAMQTLAWPITFYTQEEMAPYIEQEELQESNFVKQTIGVGNVCETTALLAAKSQTLLQKKTIYPKTTVAIALVTSK